MRHKGGVTLTSYLDGQIGVPLDVLMENGGIGRTPQFVEMDMRNAGAPPAGAIVKARALRREGERLIGEVAA